MARGDKGGGLGRHRRQADGMPFQAVLILILID
jgi:hypothetical protein